ncbi:hypothetical protein RvY_17340 [Ramazzottius varieornatus]|uniref:Uncharacterized protein n=1 Tax=Ramazzottius varieornatus TaxID=947166 RepID=A0A1D1W7Q1_RAMVA|nr:hypothetical protein RvY_17340 [Ramazzottius varieornatus]
MHQTPLRDFPGQSTKRFRLNDECNGGQYGNEISSSKRPLEYMEYEEKVSSSQGEKEPGWLGNVSHAASRLLSYGSGIAAKVGSLFLWKWADDAPLANEHVDDYDYYAMPGQKRKLNSEVTVAEQTAEPEKFIRVTPPDSKSEAPFSKQSVFQLPFRTATQKEALERQQADSPSRRSFRAPRRSVRASRISTSVKSPTTSIQSALIKPSDVMAEDLAVEVEKAHDVLNSSFVEGVSSRSSPAIVAASVVAEQANSAENLPQDLSFNFNGQKGLEASSAEKENSDAQMTPELHQDSLKNPLQMQKGEELAANSQSPAKGKENVELVSPDSPVSTPTLDDGIEDDAEAVVASSQQEAETEGEEGTNIQSLQCPVSRDEILKEEEEERDQEDEDGEGDEEKSEEVLAGHFEDRELEKTMTERDRAGPVTEELSTDREISYDEIAEDGETESAEFPETSFVKKVHRKSPPLEFDGSSMAFLAPSSSEVFDENSDTDYLSQLKAFVSASQDDDDHELMQSLEEAFSADNALVDLPSSQAAELPNVSSSENSPEEADESMEEEQDAQEVAKDESAKRASQRLWRDGKGRFVALPTADEEDEEEDQEDNQEEGSAQASDVSGVEQDDNEEASDQEEGQEEDREDDDEEIICEGMYVQAKPSPFINRRFYVPADEEEEEGMEDEEEDGDEESSEEEEADGEEGEGVGKETMDASMSVQEVEGEEDGESDDVGPRDQNEEGDCEEE